MSILEDRQKTADAIAEGKFIDYVLRAESLEIDKDVKQKMTSFSSAFWSNRNFATHNNILTYTTLKKHRFLDMKTRQAENGVVKKQHYEIHNKPIFGHFNNLVRELTFGFTDAVKAKFHQLEK
jgi:hypothetical protein